MQISILIRNLNESNALFQTLSSIKRQIIDFEYEIVLIDNESDDDSVEIAKSFNCKIFTIPRNEFSFGYALNYGISKCKGKYVLILSAHLILLNELFLQKIPSYFNDSDVGGLRFIIPDEQLSGRLAGGIKKLSWSNEADFMEKNWKNFLVNHCAAIKKSVWKELKFDEEAIASEDKIWSHGILNKGFKILYDVPLFYMYVKPFSVKAKIERQTIEEVAKQRITGQQFNRSSLGNHILKGIKRGIKQWKLERVVSQSIKSHLN